jgi:hypothetical protein
MHQTRHVTSRRPLRRGICLLAVLALTCAAAVLPARASTCFRAVNLLYDYYSNAAHTKLVGWCIVGLCGGNLCSGTTSNYVTVTQGVPCEVCGVE